MFSLAQKALTALRLRLLRRRQFDSLPLRRHFKAAHGIDVGLYSYGCFDRWRMPGPLRVGWYCSIAATVRSTNNNHPLTALTTHPALYEAQFGAIDRDHVWDGFLEIEDDVWIGHNVVILPGCRRIGRGAVVGAGAIVTRDVERYAVVAGNPARKLRDRFPPDLAAAIEASRWWDMDMAALRALMQADPQAVMQPTISSLQSALRGASKHAFWRSPIDPSQTPSKGIRPLHRDIVLPIPLVDSVRTDSRKEQEKSHR